MLNIRRVRQIQLLVTTDLHGKKFSSCGKMMEMELKPTRNQSRACWNSSEHLSQCKNGTIRRGLEALQEDRYGVPVTYLGCSAARQTNSTQVLSPYRLVTDNLPPHASVPWALAKILRLPVPSHVTTSTSQFTDSCPRKMIISRNPTEN